MKYMNSIARQVAHGLRRVDTVKSVHREDSFQKIKGFENKNDMSSEDVNKGAKWTARFTNWQRKRNSKAEHVINHTCTTNRNLLTNVKWVQRTSQVKKKKKKKRHLSHRQTAQ